ncbi:MAG TPA: hypothetical protein VK168_06490 [Saprospiraceae bacterium]|nr:hypothetical protein [Saprospiraceae bacterium]
MRIFIYILLFILPFTAEASVATPAIEGETVGCQPVIPHAFTPKKERFFDRIAQNILQKRLKKALVRSDDELAKPLAISGFVCSVLGAILLFTTVGVAGLLLLLAGLVLSIFGLVVRDRFGEKWVKAMAIVGIVIPSVVVLGILVLLALILIAFSA